MLEMGHIGSSSRVVFVDHINEDVGGNERIEFDDRALFDNRELLAYGVGAFQRIEFSILRKQIGRLGVFVFKIAAECKDEALALPFDLVALFDLHGILLGVYAGAGRKRQNDDDGQR